MTVMQRKYVDWQSQFDGWADVGAQAWLTITLRDDYSALDCSIEFVDHWARPGYRSDYGDGYMNMQAYAWAHGSTGHKTAPDKWPETWSGAKSQFSGFFPSFFPNLIWCGYASDRGETGEEWGSSTNTIPITADMWDENHNLKNIPIVYLGDRWYGAGGDSLLHNRVSVAPGFAATNFDWSFFPWSKSDGGVWLSCNRSGGAKQAVKNGSWVDRKNDMYHSDRNTGYYYSNGWQRSPIVGRE